MRAILVAATLALLTAGGCATGPQVRALSQPSTDFSQYRTFGFASPLGTDQGGYQSIVSQTLKAAAQRELEARGLTYAAANPQLIVNFNAVLADKMRVSSAPAPMAPIGMGYGGRGYYGYRAGLYAPWPMYQDQTTVTQYKEGTLNIDIADAAKKQLVWEGVVVTTVNQKMYDNMAASIDSLVAAAFAKFPIAGPAAK